MGDIKSFDAPGTGNYHAILLRWLVWIVWLAFLVAPISSLLGERPQPMQVIVILGGALLFVLIYLWTSWCLAESLVTGVTSRGDSVLMRWFPWPAIIALTLLCLALIKIDGLSWGDLFYYISACVGGVLPLVWAVAGIVGLDLVVVLGGVWLFGAPWSLVLPTAGLVTIIGVVLISTFRSAVTSRELRTAREEIVYLAVAAERLRIARDLHDLLGHSLSLIALKSELARRLISQAPGRAESEIADIEEAARTALLEVREAVTGYRRPTLANELRDARGLLAAAGVAYSYDLQENLIQSLPAPIEALLSWMVREGVTNVIRHSHARHCAIKGSISMGQNSPEVRVEILDDGSGGMLAITPTRVFDTALRTSGNGLRGLAERVAALGGEYTAGPVSGGFRLAVCVPLDQSRQVDSGPEEESR
jgi:two-component system, NarL family, sensor histidine kinase DesK